MTTTPPINPTEPQPVVRASTGYPVIPPSIVPAIGTATGILGLLLPWIPEHTVAFKVVAMLFGIGGGLAALSPGARRKQP